MNKNCQNISKNKLDMMNKYQYFNEWLKLCFASFLYENICIINKISDKINNAKI